MEGKQMHKPAVKTKVGHDKSHLLPPMKHEQTSLDFVVSNMSFATSRTVYHRLYTHYICREYTNRVGLINVSVYHAIGRVIRKTIIKMVQTVSNIVVVW